MRVNQAFLEDPVGIFLRYIESFAKSLRVFWDLLEFFGIFLIFFFRNTLSFTEIDGLFR